MTTQVYIITREGRAYNDKGLHYVGSVMKEQYNVDFNDIEFNSGTAFNRPQTLAAQLKKHENAYIVLSTARNTIFIPKDCNETTIENLTNNPDMTSWEILMAMCNEEID